ncbi:MAG: DUF6596 domain-containing protein [Myxococcota bacterium]
MDPGQQIAELSAREGARILAALARYTRDIELSEECLQEAWLQAWERWLTDGVPTDPVGWVYTVARNRARDRLRQDARHREGRERWRAERSLDEAPAPDAPALGDERLALLFACCHPALDPVHQIGLALRSLCGLRTEQVARAFVEAPTATARRLSRASAKIRDANIPFAVPTEALPERVGAILVSIYLVFNEGYAPNDRPQRPDLCREALRLARAVAQLLPEPEVYGLIALMTLHFARRDARHDPEGIPILLTDQDRRLWHTDEIAVGLDSLATAMRHRRPGPYQLQAAIAALHAQAPNGATTDWTQITALYGALLQHQPTPIVELNAAVALAMSGATEQGLAWLESIQRRGSLRRYHLLPAARADLLRRLGRSAEAASAYLEALALAPNPGERVFLQRRLASLPQKPSLAKRRRRSQTPVSEPPEALLDKGQITEDDWNTISDLFPIRSGRGRPGRPARQQMSAVLYILVTGQPWRALPERYGAWRTAYHRFRCWERDGRLVEVLDRLAEQRPCWGRVRACYQPRIHDQRAASPGTR